MERGRSVEKEDKEEVFNAARIAPEKSPVYWEWKIEK